MPVRIGVAEDDSNARDVWIRACNRLEVEAFAPVCTSTEQFSKAFDVELEDPGTYFDVFVLDLNLNGDPAGGKNLWNLLHDSKKARLGQLLVSSQRVDGEELSEFVERWDAELCSGYDLSHKVAKLADVLRKLKLDFQEP